VRVIGIGRLERGDDAIGRLAARRLASAPPRGVSVSELAGEFGSLLDSWDGAAAVVVIDALQCGGEPGRVRRFDASRVHVPARPASSTHGFGLAEAVEIGRLLHRLPPALVVFGVEGECFTAGAGLSPRVAGALPALVRAVRAEAVRLAAARSRGRPPGSRAALARDGQRRAPSGR
jgi:hydrogenase maturation protease